MFAMALSGLVAEKDFQTTAIPVDFFYAKGIIEAIFAELHLAVTFVPEKDLTNMHPGRTASIRFNDEVLGFVGQVHPQTAEAFDIPETYVAEINLSAVESVLTRNIIFEDITKYPSVSRDIALLVDQDTSHQDIIDAINSAKVKRLTAIKLFDIYTGEHIEAGKKSMAYSLTFQNPEASLTDEEVAAYMAKITKTLSEQLHAEIR